MKEPLMLYESSKEGKKTCVFPETEYKYVPSGNYARDSAPDLPCLSECDVSRHYSSLASRAYGVNTGFYPLGSCTMKYNPKIDETIASLPGFSDIHPLQPEKTAQGCIRAIYELQSALCSLTGMDAFSVQPAAGAHGELTGLLIIKAYHISRGDHNRKKIIVPDSAHGTNPASASMAGFEVVNIPSDEGGYVDLDMLKASVGSDTAGLMLTNPNTLGLYDPNITEICEIIHRSGGLCYYDGANLNAVAGIARPGDMGFDVMHINLHKTFAAPHGGGGPGSGPCGCKEFLAQFLPSPIAEKRDDEYGFFNPACSIGHMKLFYGNFAVAIKSLTYVLSLGSDGIKEASETAVLNANYLLKHLTEIGYESASGSNGNYSCMHEFVLTLEKLKNETGVTAMDIAKGMIDEGIHPPTMYFPLIVHEALMFEPTETESKETLDEVTAVMKKLLDTAKSTPEVLKNAPVNAQIRRPDEVLAARKPVLKE
ncbi:MAG: aminomethyl-transferring glycine dehydrogenase subunit GcvPB [Oscillospiraceae bacterium]|nr:aminomethyl-transferring glycine dehydrogenase subunit GcvPB [Oscillospiraceae bacterium]